MEQCTNVCACGCVKECREDMRTSGAEHGCFKTRRGAQESIELDKPRKGQTAMITDRKSLWMRDEKGREEGRRGIGKQNSNGKL